MITIACLIGSPAGVLAQGQEAPAADNSDELPAIIEFALEPFTGTFDEMIERKLIRVATTIGLTTYFIDGKSQRGPTYDLVQEFEKYLKKKLGKKARGLTVIVVPSRRDQLFEKLIAGEADIAAGTITVTEERAEKVDFSPPIYPDVAEVVVTRESVQPIKSLDDLVGLEIHVRPSTSFWGTLEAINAERKKAGKETLTVVAANELLRTEDLMEMVGAEVIDATVADSPVADVFARAFGGLRVHVDTPLASGQSFAWAYRKGDEKLGEVLAGFMKTARKGTRLGNIILSKYTKDVKWIEKVRSESERKKLQQVVGYFRTYADRYDFDWLMVAAQGYQESKLNQSVRSRVGAIGIMQVMPATAKDKSVGIPDIHKEEPNIHAGTKYLDHLRRQYLGDGSVKEPDLTFMSFAAYNAGPGNLRKARRRAEKLKLDPNIWFDNVEIAMGQTVGQEPVGYVRNILKYYTAFRLMRAEEDANKKAAQ